MSQYTTPYLSVDKTSDVTEILKLSEGLLPYIKCLLITLGPEGVLIVQSCEEGRKISAKLYPVDPINCVENVSGAGDCFSSGFIHGTILGLNESSCVTLGFQTAKSALLSRETVPNKFDINKIEKLKEAHYKTLL